MLNIPHLPKIKAILRHKYTLFYGLPAFVILSLLAIYFFTRSTTQGQQLLVLSAEKAKSEQQLRSENVDLQNQLTKLKSVDQYKRNEALQKQISDIQTAYTSTVTTYEKIQDLQAQKQDTSKYEKDLAASLNYLAQKNYASGNAELTSLNKEISDDQAKIAAAQASAAAPSGNIANFPINNSAPGSGYSVQKVHTDSGDFVVNIIAADLGSTKVIVDTASDSDCHDNCPVLPLSDYVSRSGAYAGINGTYFCPTAYPSCAGKTNSFDLLVMNKNKHYFNSDNNVYSTNPAVIFQGSSVRFVSRALEWGRDTSVDGVISNYPLLVSGGNIAYSDNPDPKFNSNGPRCFIAAKGNTVYIGLVNNATMGDSAKVLKAMGMDNAMNLDEGGSTALWYGGYKAGPGRNIPNAILFVRK